MEAGYFDDMYARSDDPWGFTSRWYERRKYAISLAMLPQERYDSAFEPGCSIGVLTGQLAPRCGQLLACDGAAAAVSSAADRLRDYPHVRVQQRVLPAGWPAGTFDLLVFSEFLYYFGDRDLRTVLGQAARSLRAGGTLLAVHWRHEVPDYPRSGDSAHAAVAAQPGLALLASHVEADFRAAVYQRTDDAAISVAQAAGLARAAAQPGSADWKVDAPDDGL
jgi:SAM-dependent methyltransferase